MSRLLVVRHGQASFGAADYDQLSELGYEQSERLGRYFSARGIQLDAIYSGPAKRHRQTVEGIRRGASAGEAELPEMSILEGLAEFPAFQLFQMHNSQPLHEATAITPNPKSAFEQICDAWMAGTIESGDLETAAQFESRVTQSLREICQTEGRGKTVLVVTSGGPTMIAMKSVLGLAPSKACELLWAIANASLTELRFREDKLSLVGFNRIAHLDTHHITHR